MTSLFTMKLVVHDVPILQATLKAFSELDTVTFVVTDKVLISGVLINIIQVEIGREVIEILAVENSNDSSTDFAQNTSEIHSDLERETDLSINSDFERNQSRNSENAQSTNSWNFTVSTRLLIKAMKMFKSQLTLILNDTMLNLSASCLRNSISIDIPILEPSEINLNLIEVIDVVFTVSPDDIHLLSNFTKTHYFITESVFITQNKVNRSEGVLNADILESNIIDFNCDNLWYFNIAHLRKFVKEYVFLFSDNLCQITIFLKEKFGTEFIIQVPRLVD